MVLFIAKDTPTSEAPYEVRYGQTFSVPESFHRVPADFPKQDVGNAGICTSPPTIVNGG